MQEAYGAPVHRPRVAALVGSFEDAARARAAVSGAGAELKAALIIDAVLASQSLPEEVDAWFVDASNPALEGPLSVLLDTLNGRARDTGIPVIVRTVPELVDLAWARLPEPSAALLCDPSPAEEVAALAVALAPIGGGFHVHDSRGDREAQQLRKLSEDVDRIARVLAALTNEQEMGEAGRMPGDVPVGEPLAGEGAVQLIRTLVRARRLRDRFFPADLFADPAWDMLLDLMAARIERKRVAVSSLCIAAAVPATTALRYLKTMTGAGLFVRRPDATDGRRVFIELSDAAAESMGRYLSVFREMLAPALA